MKNLIDARSQKCWAELIDKESSTRVVWREKYWDKQLIVPDTTAKKQSKLFKLPAKDNILPAIHTPKQQEGRKKPVQGTPVKIEPIQEMRPVTPQIRSLLYDGFTKEQKGRHLYLKKRMAKPPEEKFHYPLLSSWTYGWRLGDVMEELRLPAHGRLRTLNDTFYSRNGIFYKQSATDALAQLN
ncbi:protein ATP6V1FNB [Hypanus sabinus]|uniref:protein ATP6V1FNB n=1 Tax=Hypanus sabinus TaxID=79690 RepID=UPI0028C4E556|nr:protein ATP6V1FNB [Hypanus sabinus]XP_059800199.1 protein ATP6V1FNB [Hypanus sabinus]